MNKFLSLQKKADFYIRVASNEMLPISFSEAFNAFLSRNNSSIAEMPLSLKEELDWLNINKHVLNDFLEYWWVRSKDNSSAELNDNVRAFITANSSVPKSIDQVNIEAILLPSGRIPKLWFWAGDIVNASYVDINLSHNYFILEALNRITHNTSKQLISDFIQKYKDKIDKIRVHFNKTPQYLGAGADGIAFDIGDKILKIFKDTTAFVAATQAMDRLHTNPALAKTEAMMLMYWAFLKM